MSYILEALKKAQAERQLGNAPGIHTPAAIPLPTRAPQANRKPLLIGLAAGVLVAGAVAALAWRGQAPAAGEGAVLAQASQGAATTPALPAAAAPAEAAPATAPPASAAEPSVTPAAPAPASATRARPAPPPAAMRESAPAAAPAPAAPAPAAAVTPAAPRTPAAQPATAPRTPAAQSAPAVASQESMPQAVYLPAPERVAEAPPVARAPEPIAEESLRTLQQLPEAIQREVPKVSVGGYIYSPNPSERLLLVDKMLRREGEELAPGLVLERLMPKYAVMNYRGTRYRVGY